MRSLERFWPYILISLQAGLIYGASLSYPLLYWDDFRHICENNLINPPTWEGFQKIWSTPYFGMYIPLTYTLWTLPLTVAQLMWPATTECVHWGPAFHLFSLMVHIANSILIFRILHKVSGRHVASLLGALLFCGHPLQVETIAWVSGARDLLSTFFGLCGILCYLSGTKKAANVLMTLAVLAKPSGIVFPFLAGILSWREWRSHLRSLSPAIFAGLAAVVITQSIQGSQIDSPDVPFALRIPLMLSNLGFYLWKVIWPFPLVPMYGFSLPSILADHSLLWPAMIALAAMVFLVIFRHKVYWIAVGWVCVALLPVSGLVMFGFQETSTVADRYFYLPMMGLSLAMSLQLTKKSQYAVAVLFLAVVSVLSFRQVKYWKNDETIFKHTIEVNPQAGGAHSSLAFYFMRQRRLIESESHFRKALEKDPRHLNSWLGLGRVLQIQGKKDAAEDVYRSAIENKIALPEIYNNLGAILYERGDLEDSERYFKRATESAPLYMEPRFNLGQLYLDKGRYREALAAFREAERVAPGNKLVLEKISEALKKLDP